METVHLTLKQWNPHLPGDGIAVRYFPHYVQRKIEFYTLDVVLLSFMISGHGAHIIDGDRFEEDGASLTVTHYGQRHAIVTDEQGIDQMNVYLDLQRYPLPTLPLELQAVLPLLLPLHPRFVHHLNRIVRLKFDDPHPLVDLLWGTKRELKERKIGFEEAARLQFKLFLMCCCRRVLETGFVRAPHLPSHLEDLRQHLDRAYAEPHTLGSLAKRAGLSPTALCRAFKAYTGKRVFDYLTERRIQAAMVALRGTDAKVLEIALDCGFGDVSHFYRKFHETVGVTPSEYRAQHS